MLFIYLVLPLFLSCLCNTFVGNPLHLRPLRKTRQHLKRLLLCHDWGRFVFCYLVLPCVVLILSGVAGSAMGPFNKLLDLGANIVALDIPGLALSSTILVVFVFVLSCQYCFVCLDQGLGDQVRLACGSASSLRRNRPLGPSPSPLLMRWRPSRKAMGTKWLSCTRSYRFVLGVWVGSAVFALGLRRCSFVRYLVAV